MLVDFKLDNSGDLVFQEQDSTSNILKLSFALTKTKVLKLVMDFEQDKKSFVGENAVKISFETIRTTANKSVAVIRDDEAIAQLIKMKLKTVLGELPLNKEFGSKITLLKHKDITDKNLKALENYILECISEFTSGAKVKAYPYINYDKGYTQTIMVNVYSFDKKILQYALER